VTDERVAARSENIVPDCLSIPTQRNRERIVGTKLRDRVRVEIRHVRLPGAVERHPDFVARASGELSHHGLTIEHPDAGRVRRTQRPRCLPALALTGSSR
jgi:hypothetical protein